MKRFWKDVEIAGTGEGWGVELDGRPLRTPARVPLTVPSEALAAAIAGEWRAVGETVAPGAMPLTGLANAALDRIAPDPEQFAAGLAAYGESDLLCYRAEAPPALLAWQAERWDPLLAWARRRYDVDFVVTASIIYAAQPEATVARLSHAVLALDAWRLAGLAPLVTIGGSLVAGLAVAEGAVAAEAAWDAVSLDEQWQRERWGADTEAEARLQARRAEFLSGARFLDLLG